MYVCVCNAVTEDDVRGCVLAGACSTKDVRSACGMQPGCGACTKRLRALVGESLAASPWPSPAIAGPAIAGPAAELVDAIADGPGRAPVVPACAVADDGLPGPLEQARSGDTRPAEHAA